MAVRRAPSRGSKPDKLMRDALIVALKREARDANGKRTTKLALMAEALVDKAIAGDVRAAKEIGDRVDGKPTLALEHSDGLGVSMSDFLEKIAQGDRCSVRHDLDTNNADAVHLRLRPTIKQCPSGEGRAGIQAADRKSL